MTGPAVLSSQAPISLPFSNTCPAMGYAMVFHCAFSLSEIEHLLQYSLGIPLSFYREFSLMSFWTLLQLSGKVLTGGTFHFNIILSRLPNIHLFLTFNWPGIDIYALFLKGSSFHSGKACGEKTLHTHTPRPPTFPFTHSPALALTFPLWRLTEIQEKTEQDKGTERESDVAGVFHGWCGSFL